jgi:hypothetical protein
MFYFGDLVIITHKFNKKNKQNKKNKHEKIRNNKKIKRIYGIGPK